MCILLVSFVAEKRYLTSSYCALKGKTLTTLYMPIAPYSAILYVGQLTGHSLWGSFKFLLDLAILDDMMPSIDDTRAVS